MIGRRIVKRTLTCGLLLLTPMVRLAKAQSQVKPFQGPNLSWIRHDHGRGVIVFIHGVLGDARTTWSNGTSYWPDMLTQDKTFDGQDIYVYEYSTSLFGKQFSIDELADDLRLHLNTDGVSDYKEITFVSHSMGGLVTRAFLVKYNNQFASKVRFLYFFATPTSGNAYATLWAFISNDVTFLNSNPQFRQMYSLNDPDSYLAVLQSEWLDANLSHLKSYCAYETQPEPIVGILVPRDSATLLCTEHLTAIEADHIQIVKPSDTNSASYRALKEAFVETADTAGNCTPIGRDIYCPGMGAEANLLINEQIHSIVNEQIQTFMNEQSQKRDADVTKLSDKLAAAEEWRAKYEQLMERLTTAGIDSETSKNAAELIKEDRFDDAEKVLDGLVKNDEPETARIAGDYFNRGRLYELKSHFPLALADYEKAHSIDGSNIDYAEAFATLLIKDRQYGKAKEILEQFIPSLTVLAKTQESTYGQRLAKDLNNLGISYRATRMFGKAEAALNEALDIRRRLEDANQPSSSLDIADTENSLGILYGEPGNFDLKKSTEHLKRALKISTDLAEDNPDAYGSYAATSWQNLGSLYGETQNLDAAIDAYEHSLQISPKVTKTSPDAYRPDSALASNILADLYVLNHEPDKAEKAYEQAIENLRPLAGDKSIVYQPWLVLTLNNLGAFHLGTLKWENAEKEITEAVTISRELWKANPSRYGDLLARALLNYAQIRKTEKEWFLFWDTSEVCAVAIEVETVASDDQIKKMAQPYLLSACFNSMF